MRRVVCAETVEVCLLYGLLNWGGAYLILTWLLQEQRLAQVKINQSFNLEY